MPAELQRAQLLSSKEKKQFIHLEVDELNIGVNKGGRVFLLAGRFRIGTVNWPDLVATRQLVNGSVETNVPIIIYVRIKNGKAITASITDSLGIWFWYRQPQVADSLADFAKGAHSPN